MAAVIEGDVKKNLLDRTEAEKVFRPWWDTLEDYLLNILITECEKSTTHPNKGYLILNKFPIIKKY